MCLSGGLRSVSTCTCVQRIMNAGVWSIVQTGAHPIAKLRPILVTYTNTYNGGDYQIISESVNFSEKLNVSSVDIDYRRDGSVLFHFPYIHCEPDRADIIASREEILTLYRYNVTFPLWATTDLL